LQPVIFLLKMSENVRLTTCNPGWNAYISIVR